MPTVEKTSGGSVYLRALERRLSIGDQADVGESLAAYLCEERGDFDRVDGVEELPEPDDLTVADVEEIADDVIEERIDAGECPWCDEYEGDAVGQHAASAHSDAWDDYKEA